MLSARVEDHVEVLERCLESAPNGREVAAPGWIHVDDLAELVDGPVHVPPDTADGTVALAARPAPGASTRASGEAALAPLERIPSSFRLRSRVADRRREGLAASMQQRQLVRRRSAHRRPASRGDGGESDSCMCETTEGGRGASPLTTTRSSPPTAPKDTTTRTTHAPWPTGSSAASSKTPRRRSADPSSSVRGTSCCHERSSPLSPGAEASSASRPPRCARSASGPPRRSCPSPSRCTPTRTPPCAPS